MLERLQPHRSKPKHHLLVALMSSVALLATAGYTDFEGEDDTTSLDDNDGFFITGGVAIRF